MGVRSVVSLDPRSKYSDGRLPIPRYVPTPALLPASRLHDRATHNGCSRTCSDRRGRRHTRPRPEVSASSLPARPRRQRAVAPRQLLCRRPKARSSPPPSSTRGRSRRMELRCRPRASGRRPSKTRLLPRRATRTSSTGRRYARARRVRGRALQATSWCGMVMAQRRLRTWTERSRNGGWRGMPLRVSEHSRSCVKRDHRRPPWRFSGRWSSSI